MIRIGKAKRHRRACGNQDDFVEVFFHAAIILTRKADTNISFSKEAKAPPNSKEPFDIRKSLVHFFDTMRCFYAPRAFRRIYAKRGAKKGYEARCPLALRCFAICSFKRGSIFPR